jgi:hypothetical protein
VRYLTKRKTGRVARAVCGCDDDSDKPTSFMLNENGLRKRNIIVLLLMSF